MTRSRHVESIASDEIRILELLPGRDESPIQCTLRVSPLASNQQFETLSYVWGDRSEFVPVDVCGHRVLVTESLHRALLRLRLPESSRMLWIDQLCINQDDVEEKTSQVQMMRQIYSKCSQCLLWMGDLEPDAYPEASGAVDLIEWLAACEKAPDPNKLKLPASIETAPTLLAAMEALRTIAVQDGPWWHRVWTVQEAILPEDQTFVWGPFQISWDTMTLASHGWVSSKGVPLSYEDWMVVVEVGDVGHLMARIIWLNLTKAQVEDTMMSVIRWRDRKATDPLDHVYALMGLHQPGSFPRAERCDYHLSPVRAYADFTMDLIETYGLDPLMIDTHIEHGGTENLPRWALDMKSWPEYTAQHFHLHRGYDYYNANKNLPDSAPVYDTEGTLDLVGGFVDVVKSVGEGHLVPAEVDAYGAPLPMLKDWAKLLYMVQDGDTEITWEDFKMGSSSRFRDFCRLLVGDLVRDGEARVQRVATVYDIDNIEEYLRGEDEDLRIPSMVGMTKNHRFFVTEKGLMGLGQLETKPGDEVWVFSAGRVPFVVRPRSEDSALLHRDFVGQCYVQGIMQGGWYVASEDNPPQTVRLH